MRFTVTEMSTNIVGALKYLDGRKYERSSVTPEGTIHAVVEGASFQIEDVEDFAAEAQDCYQGIWEKNEDYPDQVYLACLAYETTLLKRMEKVNGGSITKT